MGLKVEILEGKPFKVACPGACRTETEHDELARATFSDSNDQMDWWSRYQIIRCRGCLTFSFRESSSHSEAVELGPEGMTQFVDVTLYPPRVDGLRDLGDDIYYLPSELIPIYKETTAALKNDYPILVGMGLRAILEAVCIDQKLTGKLFEKINQFVAKGVLTKTRADTLHRVRALGNDSAHEVKRHTPEQLIITLNIIEHLLDEIYILPAKTAEAFKNSPPLTNRS